MHAHRNLTADYNFMAALLFRSHDPRAPCALSLDQPPKAGEAATMLDIGPYMQEDAPREQR
jgi:hypothetical protein